MSKYWYQRLQKNAKKILRIIGIIFLMAGLTFIILGLLGITSCAGYFGIHQSSSLTFAFLIIGFLLLGVGILLVK